MQLDAVGKKGRERGMKPSKKKDERPKLEVIQALSSVEKHQLARYEETIHSGLAAVHSSFQAIAAACYQIKELGLHRTEGTFEVYFQKKFGFERAHAYRMVTAGSILERMSPDGDITKQLVTESHFRPMAVLRDRADKQDEVLELLQHWTGMKGARKKITPAMVEAAMLVLNPPEPPPQTQVTSNKTAQRLLELIEAAKKKLPSGSSKEIRSVFSDLQKEATAAVIPRTTGIGWTKETWNPLEGCSRASRGCINCYAAKEMATRWAHKYPGLAKKLDDDSYAFTGKIVLEMHRLSKPLKLMTGTKFFVNSMSDLFHRDVPTSFIDQVFDVMEKASWHTFQILTKRPEIMAAYTRTRDRSDADAPANIWLGTSTEDQKTYDERIALLRNVRARIRWISAEPLLGPIKLKNTKGLDWVVVGGESEGDTKMEKSWVTSLRDECMRDGIAFFFKQWGDYGEDGKKAKTEKLSAEEKAAGISRTKSAKLDGKSHEEYPVLR